MTLGEAILFELNNNFNVESWEIASVMSEAKCCYDLSETKDLGNVYELVDGILYEQRERIGF